MEKRVNTGVLFSNRTKTNPKAPDYSGDLYVDLSTLKVEDGKVEIRLAGWKKTAKNGSVFLSLAADTMERKAPSTPMQKIQEMDDDVPF